MESPLNRHQWLIAAFILATSGIAAGKFVRPPQVPVDRLIRNTETFIKEHPEDPSGPYTLARVHYLAFALQAKQLAAFENEKVANLPDNFNRAPTPGDKVVPPRQPSGLKDEELLASDL